MLGINSSLEKYIYDILNAEYMPNHVAACSNISNDEEANLRYLGTYFPRSFVEAYNIYEQIFTKPEIDKLYNEKEEIHILVIGGGTGGDLIGLLQVINDRYDNKMIYIHSYDGNDISLRYQRNFIKRFFRYMDKTHNHIHITTHKKIITDLNEFHNILCKSEYYHQFDIIQSFKFCNELYNRLSDKNIYYKFLEVGEYCLNSNGILLLEDVTICANDGLYIPKIMKSQIRRYLKTVKTDFKYILPKSCGKWYNKCNEFNCFTQCIFNVSHRYNEYDITKITFNLMIKGTLGEKIFTYVDDEECYKIAPGKYCFRGDYYYNQDTPPYHSYSDTFRLD